jgi:hypothetical protein
MACLQLPVDFLAQWSYLDDGLPVTHRRAAAAAPDPGCTWRRPPIGRKCGPT